MEKITSLDQFNDITARDEKSIIKFYTNWCPDCRRMDMFIGEIIDENPSLNWFEINKDDFPELAEKYDVMGIPSLLIFKNGDKLSHLHSANAKTPEQVRQFLNE
ncbi:MULTISPECIES: thioredoxin family protein [Bacillaceae]|uniref:thioredoxin family protein n=1 Tax=Bacillaceae TaxID=186817 RepID=UPI001BDED5E1|nr:MULTISPECIES: thioredoxin family protein [Bacillaceae]MDX8362514.1 thioredoxin family protein [Cytobacillus sp. IB215316]MDX8364388.1 thioredoxin family protein [Cytobacillus sp. IB215665]